MMLGIERIRRFIRDQDYASAFKELQAVDSTELAKKDLGEYYLLRARVAMKLDRSASSKGDLERAIELFRHGSETALFAEAKYLMGLWLSTQGLHRAARDELMESYASFLR